MKEFSGCSIGFRCRGSYQPATLVTYGHYDAAGYYVTMSDQDAAARCISLNRPFTVFLHLIFNLLAQLFFLSQINVQPSMAAERQITNVAQGHMLTNIAVWSADSRWIVYDTRTSLDGSVFDGQAIERVEVASRRIERLYLSSAGAGCGVVTYHPGLDQVVFILGPERPTEDWQYGPTHRQGVIVDCAAPFQTRNLDARDLTPNFTPGALRGGTHVHTFSHDGVLVASTYEDAVLEQAAARTHAAERNLRGIAISLLGHPVAVAKTHPRNHSAEGFTVLATQLTDHPTPGSDQIERACEEGWIGTDGYLRRDGMRQRYALAFQGTVIDKNGKRLNEVFVLDLPDDSTGLMQSGIGPLAGTETTRPAPPKNVSQRRLTYTSERKYPGLAQPRHWLRSTPDGQLIVFLAKDAEGVVQIFGVSPNGGPTQQITQGQDSIASALSISSDGKLVAYVADSSVFVTELTSGESRRLTPATPNNPPRPEACVFSPNGEHIAYLRTISYDSHSYNQIFVIDL